MLLPYKQNFMVPPAMPENRQSCEYCEFPATDGLVLGPMGKINQLYTDYSDIVSTLGGHVGTLGQFTGNMKTWNMRRRQCQDQSHSTLHVCRSI